MYTDRTSGCCRTCCVHADCPRSHNICYILFLFSLCLLDHNAALELLRTDLRGDHGFSGFLRLKNDGLFLLPGCLFDDGNLLIAAFPDNLLCRILHL